MAQIVEVMGVGDVEFPDGMSQADIAQALKKLPVQSNQPQKNSNIITSDVPTVIGERPSPAPIEEKRNLIDYLKATPQVARALASNAIAQPVGAAYGVAKGMTSPNYGTQQGIQEAQQAGGELANKLGYQPTNPVAQEMLGSIGSAMEATKLPPSPTSGMIPSYARMVGATKPVVQEAAQTSMQTAKPVVNQMAQALRKKPSIVDLAPTEEALAIKSNQLFDVARQSGVELNAKDFATNMASVAKDLRNEGYDPRLYPKLGVAVEELTNAQIPKDFQELTTLRKFIRNAQKSTDPDERRLATTLKEDFDAYVSTIPESSVVGGDKQGLAAWKEARDTYSKLSKSEIFTDMFEKAELDRSKFTQSGVENSLAKQLRNLAKNEKQMRLFTAEEQEAIKEAAKGGTMQNLLKFYGRFSPTGPVSGIFAGGAMLAHPAIAVPLELGAIAARAGATKMRKNEISKLAALMRANKQGANNE